MRLRHFFEKIDDMDMADVIKDFYKSDAPQFKGKSKKKRRQMAIAAKLSTDEGAKEIAITGSGAFLGHGIAGVPGAVAGGILGHHASKKGKSKKKNNQKVVAPKLSNNESLQALARHVKEGVPLPDSLFRYQSEAYFDTFKKAKQLREAGALPELDWESEEMLSTDIGESVVLENGETVWLDVPYLDENDEVDLNDGMIGVPDNYYDAEERTEAFNDLQNALDGVRNDWEKQSVIDGICPECSGTSHMDGDYDNDEDSCYGWGNYGCDQGEMEGATWVEIIKFDQQNVDRKKARDEYPGDDEVVNQIARMVANMDDPRQVYQQMQIDYPHMGRAQRSNLIAQGMKKAGLTGEAKQTNESEFDVDNEKLIAKIIGKELHKRDWSDYTPYELYAELESVDPEKADFIKDLAKVVYNIRLQEGFIDDNKKTLMALGLGGSLMVGGGMALDQMSAKKSPLGLELYAAAQQGDEVAKYHYKRLDSYADINDARTLINLRIHYLEDSPREDVRIRLAKQAGKSEDYKTVQDPVNNESVNEAEYNGKKVKLNKPMRQSGGGKKYKVYVKNPKTGRVKKISFGDAGLKTKSGNKKRAKSFAARHNCEKKNDKMKAGYWACRLPRYGLVKGGKWW